MKIEIQLYIIIAKWKQVQIVKTIYVGVYNISSFYKISEIQIISLKVRFGSAKLFLGSANVLVRLNLKNGGSVHP